MVRLLADTCVWLDMAKDHQQQATLTVLEELVRHGDVSLLVPRIVVDEFLRNKTRIVNESQRSLSGVLKRAKQAIDQLGDVKRKQLAIEQLNDLDYKLPSLGESALASIARIEKLLTGGAALEASDAAKLRAADRAVNKQAPFHTHRNSMADALIMEIYCESIAVKERGVRYAFVTHNTKDFSHPTGDNRLPHPDFAANFSKIRSQYHISLAGVLQRVNPALVSDLMMEQEWTDEPRLLSEIVDVIGELIDKVWYNRHKFREWQIERGKIKLVEKETFPVKNHERRPIQRDVWEGALKSATKVEKQYGLENLGPWTDFEWGMINGKLSALRWVLGDEWDMLDT
jgi:hypothetical protein